MTCFMTYSVYSLNFSGLFPQQSEYLMTITLYFLLSMVWTLLSMAWFVTCNHYISRGKLPKSLHAFCGVLERCFFCCFSPPTPPKNNKMMSTRDASAQNDESIKPVIEGNRSNPKRCLSCCRRSPKVENMTVAELMIVESVEPDKGKSFGGSPNDKSDCINTNEPGVEAKPKCNTCDRCEPCDADFQEEKAKRKSKKDVESKCSALNYFVFLCMFFFVAIANILVWLSMVN